MQDDVLGINAGRQTAVHIDAADLRFADGHGLGGEHVADLAGADSESDRAKGAVRGGVRVAAGDGRAGLGDALLGTDDMNDALLAAREIEEGDAEFLAVFRSALIISSASGSENGSSRSSVGTM